jgi:cytochrome c
MSSGKSLLVSCVLLVANFCLPIPVAARTHEDLANQKDCFSCHSIEVRVIGPAYKDVAARYAGRSDAVAQLTRKVMRGGSGNWGTSRMPANQQVNEQEARELVEWVLSLKD